MKAKISPIAAMLLLSCGSESEPQPEPAGLPLPKNICAEAEASLNELAERSRFEYNRTGEATIEEGLWIEMPQSSKEALARTLGVTSACHLEVPPTEYQVTIKSEWGVTLMRRTVPVSTEASLEL